MALLTSHDADGDQDLAFDFHFPTSKNALIIFTRNPELGKCKTRLAKSIGDENALEVYKFLLDHTAKISEGVKADRYLFYSDKIIKEDIWDINTFRKKLQRGNNLGERMLNAFSELFDMGYDKVLIIGSDIYDLSTQDIEDAFTSLENRDFVIGPAKDGGYYLLGMKFLKPELFSNKNWGTDSVLAETLKDLETESIILMPEKNDVDVIEDIENVEAFHQFLKNEK